MEARSSPRILCKCCANRSHTPLPPRHVMTSLTQLPTSTAEEHQMLPSTGTGAPDAPLSPEERGVRGGQLAGLAVAPGRAVVVSEEAAADWDSRCRQLRIGPNVRFICRPFKGARPTEAQWLALIAHL